MKSKLSVSMLVVVFIISAAARIFFTACRPVRTRRGPTILPATSTATTQSTSSTSSSPPAIGTRTAHGRATIATTTCQTWTGVDNPLKIEGTFVGADNATLVLEQGASGDGLRVTWPTAMAYSWTRRQTRPACGLGRLRRCIRVRPASNTGVHVNTAGSPSAFSFTSAKNGFEVNGAEGYGLYVGRADNDGVQVDSAGGDGVDAVTNTAANFGGNFRIPLPAALARSGGDNAAPDLVLGGTAVGDDGRIVPSNL